MKYLVYRPVKLLSALAREMPRPLKQYRRIYLCNYVYIVKKKHFHNEHEILIVISLSKCIKKTFTLDHKMLSSITRNTYHKYIIIKNFLLISLPSDVLINRI